jgi:hypothetical protein
MATPTTTPRSHRELAHRASGGIEVTLYWRADDDSTSIEVWQPASEERVEFVVAGEHALEAFYHPFAHLPPLSADSLLHMRQEHYRE